MRATTRTALTAATLLGAAGTLTACGSNVMSLQVGDCLDESGLQGEQVSSIETIECSEPHTAEIFAEVRHDEGDFPGVDEIKAQAEEGCWTKFEEFVGIPYEESELYFSTLSPSEESWTDADDRTSLCIILADEEMTGSLEGAAR